MLEHDWSILLSSLKFDWLFSYLNLFYQHTVTSVLFPMKIKKEDKIDIKNQFSLIFDCLANGITTMDSNYTG